MSVRIFIENAPPFTKVRRHHAGGEPQLVDGSMEEGEKACRHYLAAGLRPTGFHHSDLDPYESAEIGRSVPAERFDTFEYARFLQERLGDEYPGLLVPHHIGVYRPAAEQVPDVGNLARHGVRDVVVVGKPHRFPPANASYKATVEEILAQLAANRETHGCHLGAIGIHLRSDEPERIARKFEAAGGRRLRLMGQFLDEADSLVEFLGRLASTFESRNLNLEGVEYNVGLAIFGLKSRRFYARLLRKEVLACESRFMPLGTREQRLEESVRMNLEFADRAIEAGRRHGIDIGFSIQPLIEHLPTGRIHPAVDAAIELAKRLERHYGRATAERASGGCCSG